MTITTNISDDNSTTPLSPVQGGTGLSSFASGSVFYASATNVISALAIGAANAILITNGSIPVWSGLSSPVYAANSNSTITAAVSTGYVVSNAGLVTINLPTTFAVGAQISVQGQGGGGWKLTAGTATTIQYGTQATSSAGSLASTNQYDNCVIIGIVANTTWAVLTSLSSGLTVT